MDLRQLRGRELGARGLRVSMKDCKIDHMIARFQDYKIARLQASKLTRLQDCKVAVLHDCNAARLRDCKGATERASKMIYHGQVFAVPRVQHGKVPQPYASKDLKREPILSASCPHPASSKLTG